jgi:two-component system, OmpR family, sensor kinase
MAATKRSAGFWHSVGRLSERTPLRVKLITAVLALVAMALAVISLVGIGILRNYLLSGVDQTLAAQGDRVSFQLQHGGIPIGQGPQYEVGQAVTWVPDHGAPQQLVIPVSPYGIASGQTGQQVPGPALPANADSLPSNASNAITVGSTSGNTRWRIIGFPSSTQTSNGPTTHVTHGTVVVATDASTVYRTIGGLASIDLIVSSVVILLLGALAAALIRASLRPLVEIERTAGAIAAGDLTRRVPDEDPRTEVGRLGRSLNVMLSQIETAFRARSKSETAARRSEERMRQFVADASHELRTPLTAIRGFAEYYRQRGGVDDSAAQEPTLPEPVQPAHPEPVQPAPPLPAPPLPTEASQEGAATAIGLNGNGKLAPTDLDRIMRRVEQESARMGVLVEDMLLLARLDQQRPLNRSTVDLLTLAADAVHDARVVAPDRSINLTVGAGAALLVNGDEVRLRQVIGNLMSNALSHTPAGTPIDVHIRSGSLAEVEAATGAPDSADTAAASTRASRAAAVLEVTDQGPGLTKEQAEHAFERFYRADQARTPGGTGLGLAIVAALVAAHGGAVWVRSQPGKGATFHIALPLTPEAVEEAGDHEDDPADAATDDSRGDHAPDGLDQAPGHARIDARNESRPQT